MSILVFAETSEGKIKKNSLEAVSYASASDSDVTAVVLGAILSIVLSAANAYCGLFAGLTVSASIPAAVISMALWNDRKRRLFKPAHIRLAWERLQDEGWVKA